MSNNEEGQGGNDVNVSIGDVLKHIFALAAALGFFYIGYHFFTISQAELSNISATTTGNVINTYITSDTMSEGGTTYHVDIKYNYTVDGKVYQNDRVWLQASPAMNSRDEAENFVDRHDENITVHYNPDKPEQSYLIKGTPWLYIFFMLLGGLFFLGIMAVLLKEIAMLLGLV